jgi:RNA polymerase II subunit A small phosphatase-like protein
MLHPSNGIPILSWYSDPFDSELTKMMPLLTKLARVKDVRDPIS